MNSTVENPLGIGKETKKNPLDVRIVLAVLWIAEVLSLFKWGYVPIK